MKPMAICNHKNLKILYNCYSKQDGMIGMVTKTISRYRPFKFLLLGHGLKPLDVTFMRQIHDKVSFADHQ
jgi:hypothetical protein